MKRPPFQRLRRPDPSSDREKGVTMVLVALAMVAIIAVAALSIDVITLYLAREEAQRSADGAALAAAQVISLSGMTGDPGNSSSSWGAICGGASSPASQAAIALASQVPVSTTIPSTTTVTYSAGGRAPVPDCSSLPAAFGVNPMVTVQVRRTNLPAFFSRIWGNTTNSVSATATAEAFNPSGSNAAGNGPPGSITPVQPKCVKPLMIPNQNPNQPLGCNQGATPTACRPFVVLADGSLQDPGVQPTTSTGVIGGRFTLFADCGTGAPCNPPPTANPQANVTSGSFNGQPAPPLPPNLQYLPGAAPAVSPVAIPSCAASGGGGNPNWEPAVSGCDENTRYQCGVPASPSVIDLSENPGGPAPSGDAASALACLLVNDPITTPLVGPDFLDTTSYPYKINAGSSNPTGLNGTVVTASNSIITLPIFDNSLPPVFAGPQANVTIVGFLQVFVNQVRANGTFDVTVLNVSGCGNGTGPLVNAAVTGSSPVPVRLITPP